MVSTAGKRLNKPVYVVGGWVRDALLERPSSDIDVVVVGSGIELASLVAQQTGRKKNLKLFRNFGTAMLTYKGFEVEFVGARKESYRSDSRKPVVEDGSLEDDIRRRDFTINAMAISLNESDYGSLVDPFDGLKDLKRRIIRTPLDPDVTYADDPLRMMRAVRFATQLNFDIDPESFEAVKRNAERISIVSTERIMDEFNKIMMCPMPGKGIKMLRAAGLLKHVLPEVDQLNGVDVVNGKAHKDNFYHTLQVLDKLAEKTDDLWLRWAALLHDVAKPLTKRFDEETGWTFHGHEYLGHKMVKSIFRRLKMPMNEKMRYVQKLVLLHLRPIALTESVVTDSALRRLLFEAGDDIDDLMLLCEADITSGNREKVSKYLANFARVRQRLKETEEKDRLRNWQPPVTGDDIMDTFGIPPSKQVGVLKTAIREAILEGIISNNREEALRFMLDEGKKMGLKARQ
ncbi:MAG: HD domain-containing protein [Bacteroidales bacterium]|nr:HD domain-containing protein [Bacteroidales bacterium]